MHSLITKLWSQMKNIVLERILYLTEDACDAIYIT